MFDKLLWLGAFTLCWAVPTTSRAALQPLVTFLEGAKHANHDMKAAAAQGLQKHYEAESARSKLLPALDIGGTYTRNAYKATFPAGPGGKELVIMPYNQLEATAALSVPIVDIASWAKFRSTRAQAEAAQAGSAQTELTVRAQVMMRYYALLGQEGLLQAATRREGVAKDNLINVQSRAEVGSSSSLDVARAQSDVAQAQQDAASALLQVQLSRRALETLTGVAPEPGGALGEVPLTEESALASWLGRVGDALPPVRQAHAQGRAARAVDSAARWGYLPTLSARGTERYTNASGLNGGHPLIWGANVNLAWHFDLNLPAVERQVRYGLKAAREAEASAERDAADRIFRDYAQIQANLAKSAAARSQVAATKLGAQWAAEKYTAGLLTQLEVSQAQRDAFSAEAARIQADTDLLYYRAMLRLDAGMAPERLEEAP